MSDEIVKKAVPGEELVLELVELENGDLGLCSTDHETGDEPMLRVGVSDELRERLQDRYIDIARVMLTAGVRLVAEAGAMDDQLEQPEERPTVH
ncbi:MAG: hypothetical protein OIF57_12995 [Marinobacterium sp.]|nr:hypothetical protein [Marinobacterium sp.]